MKFKLLVLLFCLPLFTTAQKIDKKLQTKLQEAIAGFNGDIGIYTKNLRTGKIVSIIADTIFPTASIVKVPILLGIMDKIRTGELNYDSSLVYKDSLLYEGSDILGSFKSGENILLKKLIMLMLTTSDNTASLWLQSLAGKGARINEILDSIGLKDTRVNSRTPGRENNRTQYGWGQTTPKEMGAIFEKIYRNEIFSPVACERSAASAGITGTKTKPFHKYHPLLKCSAKMDV
jgi:beta-lactamase class A